MYFLKQIQKQFLASLYAFQDATPEAPIGGNQEPVEEIPTRQGSPEQLALQELNEELDAIENDSRLITRYCQILGSFLERVRDGRIEGLNSEDDDFERLLTLYKGRFDELKDLSERGHQIQHIVTAHVERLQGTIDEGIAGEDISDNIMREYTEHSELSEQQTRLNELETRRQSYEGILRDKISEYGILDDNGLVTGYELSDETLQIIQEINELLGEELTGDVDTQIARVTEINEEIYNTERGLDTRLNISLEFEEELVLRNNYIDDYLNFQMPLIEGREIPQEIQEQFQIIRDREITGTLQVRIEALRADNQELSAIVLRLRSELSELTEEEREELDRLRSAYDDTLLLITEKVGPFIGQEGLTRNMQAVLEEFTRIQGNLMYMDSDTERRSDMEVLSLLRAGANNDLLEFDRLLDIAIRDESRIGGEDGEKLGDIREASSNAAYERALENNEVQAALQDSEGNVPIFEELRMNDIVILRDAGVNLSEIFLVDQEGNSISGNVEAGKSYIINFGENVHLSGKIDFAFLAMNTREITVDGNVLTFENNSFRHDGEIYNMRDGSLIEVRTNFEDEDGSEERTERHQAINEYMDSLGASDTHQEVIRAALSSPNPQEALDLGTLPGGLVGFILAMLLNIGDGRNFRYDAERGVYVDQQDEPLTAQDALDGHRGVYYDNGQRVDINSSFENLPPGVAGLVNTIYQAESGGDPNIIYGGCPIQPPRPITQMSVREVRRFQDRMVSAGSRSSAVGACQIIRGTMDGAISAGVLDPSENFNVAAQNRFTIWKMEQRGLNRFMSGQMSDAQFMLSLSQEWASLPRDMGGASYYAGDGLNHALVSPQTIMRHLREIGQG